MDNNYSQYNAYSYNPQLNCLYPQSNLNPSVNYPIKLEIVHAVMDEAKLPERPDALVEGLLRTGGKMVLFGKDKSWKSFLAIQLGVCVAIGHKWLGFTCKQGKVAYLNLEIDHAAFMKRVYDVATALGADPTTVEENYLVIKRPRVGLTINQFVDSMAAEVESQGCSLIIIDPQYKIYDGNENEQRDMTAFYAEVDKLIACLGCAVLVVHHQSKGYQGNKEASERACGSSVFGRDPDAIMSVDRLNYSGNAMRAEFVLRDYPGVEPVNYWFEYPLCVLDESGELARCTISYRKASISVASRAATELTEIESLCEGMLREDGKIKCADIAKALGKKSERVKDLLRNSKKYRVEKIGKCWFAMLK